MNYLNRCMLMYIWMYIWKEIWKRSRYELHELLYVNKPSEHLFVNELPELKKVVSNENNQPQQ